MDKIDFEKLLKDDRVSYYENGIWHKEHPAYDENEVYQGHVKAWLVPDSMNTLLERAYTQGQSDALELAAKAIDKMKAKEEKRGCDYYYPPSMLAEVSNALRQLKEDLNGRR